MPTYLVTTIYLMGNLRAISHFPAPATSSPELMASFRSRVSAINSMAEPSMDPSPFQEPIILLAFRPLLVRPFLVRWSFQGRRTLLPRQHFRISPAPR